MQVDMAGRGREGRVCSGGGFPLGRSQLGAMGSLEAGHISGVAEVGGYEKGRTVGGGGSGHRYPSGQIAGSILGDVGELP